MKLAVTVWEQRVSPVFDSARTLLIAKVKHQKIQSVSYHPFNPRQEGGVAWELSELGIEVLICGAISKNDAFLIEAASIRLIPFIAGDADRILGRYAEGRPIIPHFLMPGCKGNRPNVL